MDYFQTPRLKQILGANYEVKKYIDDSIEEHQKTLGEEEEEPRDFIDAVIIERRKRPFDKSLSAGQIQQTIVDLFGGGKKEKGKKRKIIVLDFWKRVTARRARRKRTENHWVELPKPETNEQMWTKETRRQVLQRCIFCRLYYARVSWVQALTQRAPS